MGDLTLPVVVGTVVIVAVLEVIRRVVKSRREK